ncbi:MAG: hypothetical protein A3J93_04160 [Candidatus Magasanikbacteria bacterium RIFOXYC2_FULL_42_28]|uniref:PpiC domain-containing protein n=1 Tax=Candidatus Magasanikbacteria bacterium RIFOXYC2_FULL_42_28 TaxID=1798704 RepID=A0A1F6NWY0_9BACT|nr:MAG: hypothetical protein A3J93_04160 [Candidatus Magasanikbacteria bacterium RIFOXYC2_FULL_42_28]
MTENNTSLEGKNLRLFGYGALTLVGVVLLVVVFTAVFRVYAKAATDPFTVGVAKILRLPAGKVNGTPILYADYADDMKAIQTLREFDKTNNGPTASLTEENLSDQVLWRAVNNILIDDAAKAYGVKVEATDVDALKTELLQQFANTAELDKALLERYGWTLADYEKKVINGYVLQQKLTDKIGTDQKLLTDTRALAEKVLGEIKAGADFAEMAKQYGQDGTAATGGDLGFFKAGEMVPEFEIAAFATATGTVVDSLVETQFGYHVIKVIDKKTEEVVNPDTKKKEKVESVQASHILFRLPSIDTYLNDASKQANINLYLRIHDPFADLKK